MAKSFWKYFSLYRLVSMPIKSIVGHVIDMLVVEGKIPPRPTEGPYAENEPVPDERSEKDSAG